MKELRWEGHGTCTCHLSVQLCRRSLKVCRGNGRCGRQKKLFQLWREGSPEPAGLGASPALYRDLLISEEEKEGSFAMNQQRTSPRGARRNRARGTPQQVWLARGRRRFPFLFSRIGPVTLSICSVLLMSLMAILY